MGTLLRLCPDVLIGRHLAITSLDSSALAPTDKQRTAGWDVRGGIGYSPLIDSVDDLPFQIHGSEAPGFDEWYVFEAPNDLRAVIIGNPFVEQLKPGRLMVFVNYPDFVLHDPDPARQSLAEMFWDQINWIQPESYIADGQHCLTFVSRNVRLFESVRARLSADH